MKTILKTILVAILVFGLTGCFETIVIKDKYIVVAPTDAMLQNCDITKPPDRETYINSTADERELLLWGLSMDLYKSIAKCNSRWEPLRNWKKEQIKLYQDKSTTK